MTIELSGENSAPNIRSEELNKAGQASSTMLPSPTDISRSKLWMAAIKPPMYTVAVIPIWVGTAIAASDTGVLHWRIFLTFLLSAILIIAWLNASNDVFDSDTGIDQNKHHSLVNLTGNRALIFWLSTLFLIVGILGIVAIAWWQQDWTILGIVVLCCALGYSYQGPPFRLGYLGLGEPICFITFGPLALTAAYYSQAQTWNSTANLAASIIIGMTTSIILFCSHFHQVADDVAAGKRSPIVRLGTQRGSQWLTGSTVSVYILLIGFVGLRLLPVASLLMLLSFPLARKLYRFVATHHDSPAQVSRCKFIAVELHFWSGLLLGVGCLLQRMWDF
ncbi:MAG: 2-carboxy-1,4-naphthoquinone phytyltransferase [Leptolyngbyaceae bacterium]|nr:2-carboxy-1,4-naphthoquinone phytyltransferase [Leptolyngbyaceae bacterium]